MAAVWDRDIDFMLFTPERLKANELTPRIVNHLGKVYTTLIIGLLIAAAGIVFDLYTWTGGMLSAIAGVGIMFWMAATDPVEVAKRQAMFAGFCFLQGMSLGKLVGVILYVDPSILVTALLGTTTVFLCFTVATLLAKRRSMVYLGGFIGTAVSWLFFSSLLNLFLQSPVIYNLQLYLGLAIFCCYVMFDTELIIAKARAGSTDYLWHAMELLIDFVGIFVRLAILLLGKKRRSDRERR